MSLKIAFALFACCALAIAQSTNTVNTSDGSSLTSTSGITSDSTGSNLIPNRLSELANRFRNAVNKTYEEEKDSVSDSWNNVKDLIVQRIQTGANLTKTAFDLGTLGPKFAKNLVLSNDDNE